MVFSKLILSLSFVSLVLANPIKSEPRRPNILMTNDDGWAVAQVRGIFAMLDATGKYNVLGSHSNLYVPKLTNEPFIDSCFCLAQPWTSRGLQTRQLHLLLRLYLVNSIVALLELLLLGATRLTVSV
jgi:hypothetical protein